MNGRNMSAFTLIELMIVVAIIAFLATLAVPQYFKYQMRARQAEVAMNLASLHTAMQAYFAEHGEYTTALAGKDGVGWKPEGYKGGGKQENFYYTYGFYFPGAQEGVNYFTGKLETPASALGQSSADSASFAVRAAGAVASKDVCDVWQMDEGRKLDHVQDGIE
ncbi:MAG: prepilin-type N-terminal cleavage/methylation domain-containing protein [Candidatus Babeliales bacterium]|jgi:prepilin-type N-terminal cleavage/methylation domain-containing protein